MTPYERLGGADVVAAITARFYDLIEHDPAYAQVKAMHGEFSRIREAFSGFLTAWLGGPRDYFDNGGPCMMSLHAKLGITSTAAGQWQAAMRRALMEQPGLDGAFREALSDALERMARAMAPE